MSLIILRHFLHGGGFFVIRAGALVASLFVALVLREIVFEMFRLAVVAHGCVKVGGWVAGHVSPPLALAGAAGSVICFLQILRLAPLLFLAPKDPA
jgi:hypothetical protein